MRKLFQRLKIAKETMKTAAKVEYASIDGRRVAYREQGAGPAIVFLHGLGGNSASWQLQFEALSSTHRVVAWDMPGFGNSDVLPRQPATTRDFSTLALCAKMARMTSMTNMTRAKKANGDVMPAITPTRCCARSMAGLRGAGLGRPFTRGRLPNVVC